MTTVEAIGPRLLEHIRNGTTDMAESDLRVPISYFTSDEHAAAERALMRSVPLVIGHSTEIPDRGSFITREVLGVPLIVARQSDGSVASYVNMCRHRGGRVESETSGSKRLFTCRYHGWSYDRDGGTLRHAPYSEHFESLDYACHGLRTVKVEESHGLVWATLDDDAFGSVEDYLGPDVSTQLAAFNLSQSVLFMEKVLPLDVNWKLVMDGAIDMLHPKFLHPNGVGKLSVTHAAIWRDYGLHGQVFSPRKRMEEIAKAYGTIEESYRYYATILRIFPNTLAITAPDHTEFWTVWPSNDSALQSTTTIRFYVRPEILDDRMVERLNRSWAILEEAATMEDFPMEQSIQANAAIDPDGTFLYGRNEVTCQHLHRNLQTHLEGRGTR